MSERRADALSPIDAATLWPQLHRLNTELIASPSGGSVWLSAGLACTGLGNLPRMSRTTVLGVRNRLSYQAVLVARELSGGTAWEAVSLRLARDKDDETVELLLNEAALETARRGGRSLFLRFAEGSPHEDALRRGGMHAYTQEQLFAPPPIKGSRHPGPFRTLERADRAGVFRLYCRALPEVVRRNEAVTQQEFRGLLDAFDLQAEWVVERDGAIASWLAIGEHEARLMDADGDPYFITHALDLAHGLLGPEGTLVLNECQQHEQQLALERGFTALGTRKVAARRLALLNPLKEAIAVPVSRRVPN